MKNNFIMRILVIMCFCILGFTISGCQPVSQGGKTYTMNQAKSGVRSDHGTVLHISEVFIQHDEKGVGTVAGGILGGVVGSTIGGGRGRTLATAGGAAAGAALGSAGERASRTKDALEIEVELEDGRILVIVQEKDDVFSVGDNVRVIEARDGTLRVRQ